jgi:adenylate cyclase
MDQSEVDRRLSAILAADVVGYSRLMGTDEEGTLRLLKRTRAELVDSEIEKYHGRIVKTTGDGMLVEFPSVVDALRCAVDVQGGMAERNDDVPEEQRLQFRVGVNMGDVIVDGDDIFGDGVNVASRLEGLAAPGGICISQAVREMVLGRVDVEFEDQGELSVKNIARPIRVYRVVLRPQQSAERSRHSVEQKSTQPQKSIAVLPFANMSPDPDNEFFSDGMSEELINLLAKLPQLRVAARTSSFAFKNKNMNVPMIAKELGVKTVLEGSVRRAGKRIRITGQLIDADSGFHLWSETYDRDLEDIFEVQDEIAHKIVDALEITLSPKQERAIQKVQTTDVDAYDYYLRGRKYYYEERGGGLDQAMQMFTRAIEIDPNYALAHAGLADTCAMRYFFWERDEAHLKLADQASRRALELNPELAEAHAARGHVLALEKRYEEAEREFETAIRLDPKLFEAYYLYARAELLRGRFEKSAEMFEQASVVRPEDYQAPLLVQQVYRSLGKEAKARDANRRGLKIVERHLELNPDDQRALALAANAAMAVGELDRAMDWANRALELGPNNPSLLYNLACFYALAGEVEDSLNCLERRATLGSIAREWMENDSDLDSIRNHPRFQAVLKQL